MDLNRTTIIGNVTQDIEMKQTPNGAKVCSFSIATNRAWKNDQGQKVEDAEFHNVVLWGKLAELAEQYCQKGNRIYFEGRLRTRSRDGEDGKKRYKTEIIGENFILLGGKKEKDEFAKSDAKHGVTNDEITVEDIPF